MVVKTSTRQSIAHIFIKNKCKQN
uniref:Uncharacterized protein n=1 Tax=Arundo donax TaxID=35708 RepID=A0A0A8YI99_ARUDO